MKKIVNLKAELAKKFSMKDLSPTKKILGTRNNRKRKEVVEDIISRVRGEGAKKVNMSDAKHVNVVLGGHFKFSKAQTLTTEDEKALVSEVSYASDVSNMMYVMVCTSSDIAQAVGVVSRYMSNSEKEHWRAVKWILRYLKGSSSIALCYDGTDVRLHEFVDSDFAGDVDSRKSTTSYVSLLEMDQ